jgi:hypothetical protein
VALGAVIAVVLVGALVFALGDDKRSEPEAGGESLSEKRDGLLVQPTAAGAIAEVVVETWELADLARDGVIHEAIALAGDAYVVLELPAEDVEASISRVERQTGSVVSLVTVDDLTLERDSRECRDGARWTVRFGRPASSGELREALVAAGLEETVIKRTTVQGGSEFIVYSRVLFGTTSAPPVGPAPAK